MTMYRRNFPATWRGPSAFTHHVPVHPHGTDPSLNNRSLGQPSPVRETMAFGWVATGNGTAVNGRLSDTGSGLAGQSGLIACTQANVTYGTHVIHVGDYELRPGIDFAIGASDADLATNLAAAIAALPGFEQTTANAGVVNVVRRTAGGLVEFRFVETGAASAFSNGTVPPPYEDAFRGAGFFLDGPEIA